MWRASTDVRSFKLTQAFAESAAAAPQVCPVSHQRASFEVSEDHEALRLKLAAGRRDSRTGQTQILAQFNAQARAQGSTVQEQHEYETWRAEHPCVLQRLDDIRLHLRGKRLAVFLDYDGTLTPIVSNPDDAVLSQQMREVVRSVARLFPTAIISGRGREKVENFVQLKELYYAGSHGMDIAGPVEMSNGVPSSCPSAADMAFQPAAHFKPLIDAVYKELCEKLQGIPGSSVEHNTFCVSAHFRNCSSDRWQDVLTVVEEIVARNPELRLTRGRKVVEVRPKVNWHKGTALDHLLGVLGLRACSDVVAVYIGDDHTDEDAFRVLRDTRQGFGVLVSTKIRETAAAYTVRDPGEVQLFLQALVSWGMTDNNGWLSVTHKSRLQQSHSSSQSNSSAGGVSHTGSTSSADTPANSHGQLSLNGPLLQATAMPSS